MDSVSLNKNATIQKANPIYSPSLSKKIINEGINDTFGFSEMYMKHNDTIEKGLEERGILTGKINGKNFTLKQSYSNDDSEYIEGEIGEKKINLETRYKKNRSNINTETCIGEFNGKKFEFEFNGGINFAKRTLLGIKTNDLPKVFIIKGKYNNNPVEIRIPGSKIPKDSELRDLVTLISSRNGFSIETYKDEIVGFDWKQSLYENYQKIKEKDEEKIKENVNPVVQNAIGVIVTGILTSVSTLLLNKFIGKK